ncbi:MAG: hypothetical protein COB49_01425 [Alphaproteobacteria bacterium]|nr:MAG: hypothetical protein COB49_01425 [Alphaproteobacteria bacterium]
MKLLQILFLILAVLIQLQVVNASETSETAQINTVIYAGEALLVPGQLPKKAVIITIADGRILKTQSNQPKPVPSGLDTNNVPAFIDLSCCFVMPGFIDVQTHLQSGPGSPPWHVRMTELTDADFTLKVMINARNTLQAGFTSIRDMGHSGRSVFSVHDAIEKGRIEGPRMQVAGEVIRPTGGELRSWLRPEIEPLYQVSAVCDGPYDCKRAVRAQAAQGATTIKVVTKQDLGPHSTSQFDLMELIAIREAGHDLGLKVTASAFSTPSINLPLKAGFDGVVHGTYVDDETLKLFHNKDAIYIPTLLAARVVREMAENAALSVSDAWRKENMAIYHGMVGSFRRALKAGVKIAFGTDAGWRPHGGNAEQMVQMVELGMSPGEVLNSATLTAAAAMGWDDKVGSLIAGKFADIVATRISPLDDINTVMSPVFVMKNGKTIRQEIPQ